MGPTRLDSTLDSSPRLPPFHNHSFALASSTYIAKMALKVITSSSFASGLSTGTYTIGQHCLDS